MCLDVEVIRVIGVFGCGDEVEKEDDGEAYRLDKCSNPLAVASFSVVLPPKECGHRLAREQKE